MTELTHIYTLSCPESGLVRYVGKSDNPKNRFKRHIELCNNEKSHKISWIRGLINKGLLPVLNVIDTVPWCDWKEWEKQYIKMYKASGANLVNSTLGGDGGLSLEGRKKISEFFKGKDFLSPEQRIITNKILTDYSKSHSPWNKGKNYKVILTNEQSLKKSISQKGKHGGKPILQYDLDGNFIKEWASAYDVWKNTGISFHGIFFALKNNGTFMSFSWKYKTHDLINIKIEAVNPKRIKSKKVAQIDRFGNIINTYLSPKEAQDKTGFNLKGISLSCYTEGKSFKNYFWKYI